MNIKINNQQSEEDKQISLNFSLSPTRIRHKSPNKFSGWQDDQNHFLAETANNKSKNNGQNFRIHPSKQNNLKIIINNDYLTPKIKNSIESPRIILRLKQQLQCLESPKKKPTQVNQPIKMVLVQQIATEQQIKQKNKIEKTLTPETVIKKKRFVKNSIFDLTKLRIRKQKKQKKTPRESEDQDSKYIEFNNRLTKIVDQHTTPILLQKSKSRTTSEMPQINIFSKQNTTLKKNLPQWPLNPKFATSKTPLIELYKMIMDERQNQQYKKHLQMMLLMSRIK